MKEVISISVRLRNIKGPLIWQESTVERSSFNCVEYFAQRTESVEKSERRNFWCLYTISKTGISCNFVAIVASDIPSFDTMLLGQ